MDERVIERLRSYKNLTGWWQDWGTFSIELTDAANLAEIPADYGVTGRTLCFYGACLSPYARDDGKIRVTLAALSQELLLSHADVKWMLRHEPAHGGQTELRPLWVNEAHRPK